MVLTSRAQVDAALQHGLKQRITLSKTGTVAAVAGQPSSYWRASGGLPTQGVQPTTAVVCTNATTGALPLAAPQQIGTALYLAKMSLLSSTTQSVELHDRLAHMEGLADNTMSAQTVNLDLSTLLPSSPRIPSLAVVQWWIEIYAVWGTNAATATIAYTDATGAAQTTTVAVPASAAAGRLFPIYPSTASPIRGITSVTLTAMTLAGSGAFGITASVQKMDMGILLPNITHDSGPPVDCPKIENTACLFFIGNATGSTLGSLGGSIFVVEG